MSKRDWITFGVGMGAIVVVYGLFYAIHQDNTMRAKCRTVCNPHSVSYCGNDSVTCDMTKTVIQLKDRQ